MATQLSIITDITTEVSTQVRGYVSEGELAMPANYSAGNALKAAMLMLPSMESAGKSVLETCTIDSIKGSLLSMCVQGLNPDKKQCYFIAYGNKLTLSRSYFGDIALVKRLDPDIDDVFPCAVFDGDVFTYEINRGVVSKINHEQKIENKDNKINSVYAIIAYKDGHEVSTVMTIAQVHKAWKQSKQKPFNEDGSIKPYSIHGKFPEEMAMRTVVHKACKPIINASNDGSLLGQYIQETTVSADAAEVEQEITENANSVVIEGEFTVVPEHDAVTGELFEQKEADPF